MCLTARPTSGATTWVAAIVTIEDPTHAPPRAIVLRAPGTNCDEETAAAWRAGRGRRRDPPRRPARWSRPARSTPSRSSPSPAASPTATTSAPAGSSPPGSGTVLGDALRRFRDRGGLILGICNGFQVLVKAGLLPGGPASAACLTFNDSGQFESRWVRLSPTPGVSPFLTDAEPIELPVAHGEGNSSSPSRRPGRLEAAGQVVLRYADDARPADRAYPGQPQRVAAPSPASATRPAGSSA